MKSSPFISALYTKTYWIITSSSSYTWTRLIFGNIRFVRHWQTIQSPDGCSPCPPQWRSGLVGNRCHLASSNNEVQLSTRGRLKFMAGQVRKVGHIFLGQERNNSNKKRNQFLQASLTSVGSSYTKKSFRVTYKYKTTFAKNLKVYIPKYFCVCVCMCVYVWMYLLERTTEWEMIVLIYFFYYLN